MALHLKRIEEPLFAQPLTSTQAVNSENMHSRFEIIKNLKMFFFFHLCFLVRLPSFNSVEKSQVEFLKYILAQSVDSLVLVESSTVQVKMKIVQICWIADYH